MKCHFIFNIKKGENFRRKARLVANENETETPEALTYSSVVSRDLVRIALLVASLNEFRLKVYMIAGPEFGSKEGMVMIIRTALYVLKSSGAAF